MTLFMESRMFKEAIPGTLLDVFMASQLPIKLLQTVILVNQSSQTVEMLLELKRINTDHLDALQFVQIFHSRISRV